MAMKRLFNEEGGDDQHRLHGMKFQKVVKYVMKETFIQELVAKLEPVFQRVVKKELEPILFLLQSSPRPSLVDVDQPKRSATRALELQFINKLPSVLFTNSRIKAEGNSSIEIKLLDANTKCAITDPLFGSMKVEVLALNGDFVSDGRDDWSEEEFSDIIVREREGKRPLLVGDLSFSLVHGVGVINKISFTDNSSWVRSRKFRLGVRALPFASQGVGIKEAVSDSFVVLDNRGEPYQKHRTPALDDPVWRLKKIAKDGALYKRLAERRIDTVKDFLKLYHVNAQLLRNILGRKIQNKAWEVIIEHANACPLNNKEMYGYWNAAKGLGLLFNCVYKVEAATFDGQNYLSVDTLNVYQTAEVEELKHYAYNNLKELVPVDTSWSNCLSAASIIHDISPFSCPNDVCIGGQGELNFYGLETSAAYPYLMDDDEIQPQEDSAVFTFQPVQSMSSTMAMGSLEMGDSSGSPLTTVIPDGFHFVEEIYPFEIPTNHVATVGDWGQATDLLATCSHDGHIAAIQMPRSGRPKAGWCKIRAAVKWKIAKRNSAARRKAKSSFCYH
ncbi:hypothetical protein Dimus_012105 [Dionaea muscipula]